MPRGISSFDFDFDDGGGGDDPWCQGRTRPQAGALAQLGAPLEFIPSLDDAVRKVPIPSPFHG